jgi:hypothetical protein
MLSLPVCALRSITTMQDLKMGEFDAQLEYAVLRLFASHSVPAIISVTFRGNLSGNVALLACAHCTSSMPEASTNEPRYSPTFAQRITTTFGSLLGCARYCTFCLFWRADSATSFERPNTVTSVVSEWYLHHESRSTCAVTAAVRNSRYNAPNALRHSVTRQDVARYASKRCYSCGAGQSGNGLTCSTREHGWTEMISRQNQ